jgi:signal transduction histidine kinase/ActR/RegA family two-component response regulator
MKQLPGSSVESNLITLLEMSHLKEQGKHTQESEQLRATIKDLLVQLEGQFDLIKDKNVLEQLVIKLRNANQNLVIASVEAQTLQESAEQAKYKQEQFLAMLAHELRNPLAPIMMATELIAKLTDSHEQLPRLHGILSRQVGQLSHLVDDLVDASRISSGRISLHKQHFSLKSIIENAIEISAPFIEQRHQSLHPEFTSMSLYVYADFLRLSQVFSNLLINASKFSPEYEAIYITVRKHHEQLLITVKDHGIGITRDMQGKIFELFSQGYQAVDRAQGGLGIGLALVRSIVSMHDGSVTVCSDGLGLGSEFVVELPAAEIPASSASFSSTPVAKTRRLNILIIEDNLDTLAVFSDVLSNEGHKVSIATSGEVGLQLIKEPGCITFDLIFCDLGLPTHDGFEIAKRIRALPCQLKPCLVAYTGYNQLEDRERARDAGFDHFLVKPIATDVLLNLISTWVES